MTPKRLLTILLLSILLAPSSLVPASQVHVIARLFAATSDAPFITYSWGEHWQKLRGDLRGFTGAFDVFHCLGPTVFAGGADGLFQSDDYGENYHAVASWPGGAVTALLSAELFAQDPTLFAGTENGLYRSLKGGSDWEQVGELVVAGEIHAIVWPGPDSVFVATDRGLFVSKDRGTRWEPIRDGLPQVPHLSLAVSRFFAIEPAMFVGTKGAGLFVSRDGGETFLPVEDRDFASRSVSALFWWGELLLAGTLDEGLFISNDMGESFEAPRAIQGHSVFAISVPAADAGTNSDIIVGTEAGVFKSADGGESFRPVQEGMGSVQVRHLSTFPQGPQNSR